MVGNAEPVKEYNYRPLSKLCECQLDVNDQVSTKRLAGRRGGGGQAEVRGGRERSSRNFALALQVPNSLGWYIGVLDSWFAILAQGRSKYLLPLPLALQKFSPTSGEQNCCFCFHGQSHVIPQYLSVCMKERMLMHEHRIYVCTGKVI